MTNSPRPFAALTIALALGAVEARAQSPAPDPLESAAIRIGSLGINPSLVIRDLGRDNNVFNEAENPKSDFTFTIIPRADILFHPRGLRLTATTASDLVYYEKYTSERSTNNQLRARIETDLWRFQPFASVSALDSRARYNQEIDTRAHHRDRGYTAGLRTRLSPRTTFTATARWNQLRFDNGEEFRGEDLAATMNSRLDVFDGTLGFELTPITTFSIAVSDEMQRFDTAVERDADTLRVTPTLTFSPEGLLAGSASVGYRRFRPKTDALPAYSGAVASVNLGATLYGRHKLEAAFSRDLRYSYEADTPYYLSTGGTLTWTTKFYGPLDVRLTASRQLMDYRQNSTVVTPPPNDTYAAYGGGLGYTLRENLRVGLNAEWSQRISERSSTRDYHNRRIFASLTWGRPQS